MCTDLRTYRNLHAKVISHANIRAAFLEACRGKRRRPDVAAFAMEQEVRLARLARALETGSWRPGGYRLFAIREPKPRLIAAAPFPDRIVHHAVHRVLAPLLCRRFMPESFACLPGRGSHRAVLSFQQGLRRHAWLVRLDMKRYFLEIRWEILLSIIGRSVRDSELLALLEIILCSGAGLYQQPRVLESLGLARAYNPEPRKGLPIGNLTSQIFANVYLDGLDHFARRQLKVPHYIRYMDDVVIFGERRGQVREWAEACTCWLAERRRLETHRDRQRPLRTPQTFRFLGHVVSRDERRITQRTVRRMLGKVRRDAQGETRRRGADLEQSMASSLGSMLF